MTKYIVSLLFILAQISWATDVTFTKDVSIENDLKNEIVAYWKNRGEREFKKTYTKELPYLQYLHSQKWYKTFFANAPEISLITVKGIKKYNDENYTFSILIHFEYNPDSPTFLYDKWMKIDGKWYHKYNDNPLPM